MATLRVSVNVTSPSTQFNTFADMMSQDAAGNYSTVYMWLQAVNTGGTTSFEGNSGTQSCSIAGTGLGSHTSTLPSGVPSGGQRWYDGPWGINLGHDAAGNRNADQIAQGLGWSGWISRTDYGSIGPYPRIPKVPSIPGKPVISKIMPTSVTVSWTGSADNGGSAITGYLVRRWTGTSPSGAYVDTYVGNVGTLNVTGLTPGTNYTWAVYAMNGAYGTYSVASSATTAKTIAPMHVKVAGVWHYAVPYVKVSAVWKMAQPYVKVNGAWKLTG
jgi:hypothetical protein